MFHSGAPKVQRAILNERAWARRPPGVQPAEAGGFRRKRAEEDPEFLEFLGNAAVRVGSGSGPGYSYLRWGFSCLGELGWGAALGS